MATKKPTTGKPKSPQTAFFCFCDDNRSKVREQLPENTPASQVAMKLGEMWKDLDDDAKEKYQEMADLDRIRYKKEMEDFKSQPRPMTATINVGGAKISFDIDPEASEFNRFFKDDITVWLNEYADENDKDLLPEDEIKEKVLPILLECILKEGGVKLNQPLFGGDISDTLGREHVYAKIVKHIDLFIE